MPADYAAFLSVMGKLMGSISIQNWRLDIGTVLEYYRRPTFDLPPDALFIGRGMNDVPELFFLQKGRVVSCVEGDDEFLARAGSLWEMIGTYAFRKFRLDIYPYGVRYCSETSNPTITFGIEKAFHSLGFSSLWFSTDWCRICEGSGAGMVANKDRGKTLVVDIAAADETLYRKMETLLSDTFKMKKLVRIRWL